MTGVQTCALRSEEHTSELQSHDNIVCRLLLEEKNSHARTRSAGARAYCTHTQHRESRPRASGRRRLVRVRGARCCPCAPAGEHVFLKGGGPGEENVFSPGGSPYH